MSGVPRSLLMSKIALLVCRNCIHCNSVYARICSAIGNPVVLVFCSGRIRAVWHSLCGIRCVARLLCLRAFAEHVGALCCRWPIRCFASSFAVAICACSACIDLSDLLLQCVFVMACCYWCVLCVYFACSCLSDLLLRRMFFIAIVLTAAVFGESRVHLSSRGAFQCLVSMSQLCVFVAGQSRRGVPMARVSLKSSSICVKIQLIIKTKPCRMCPVPLPAEG